MSETPRELLVWDEFVASDGYVFGSGVRSATDDEVRAAVRTLPGVEEIVVDIKYDAEPFMKEGPFFVDFDGEIASGLEPGRYLVVPLSEEE